MENIIYIGQVASFYIPTIKLNLQVDGLFIREILHNFLIDKYRAYTHERSHIEGYWIGPHELEKDEHERYEISFQYPQNELLDFLANLCYLMQEKCLYLTMGTKAWLVMPKPKE